MVTVRVKKRWDKAISFQPHNALARWATIGPSIAFRGNPLKTTTTKLGQPAFPQPPCSPPNG